MNTRWSSGQRVWLGRVSSSTPTSAIIYEAYTSIIKNYMNTIYIYIFFFA